MSTSAITAATAGGALAAGLLGALPAATAANAAPASPAAVIRPAAKPRPVSPRILAMRRQLINLPGGRQLPLRDFNVGAGFGHSRGPHAGRNHAGLDLVAPTGTTIFSATAGRVVLARSYYGYGNLVMVRMYGGGTVLYAHQSRIGVRKGQQLVSGDRIGRVGSTGYSTGPHLHFEVRSPDGRAVNPLTFLGLTRTQMQRRDHQLDRLR